jgi:hypothetical protein
VRRVGAVVDSRCWLKQGALTNKAGESSSSKKEGGGMVAPGVQVSVALLVNVYLDGVRGWDVLCCGFVGCWFGCGRNGSVWVWLWARG